MQGQYMMYPLGSISEHLTAANCKAKIKTNIRLNAEDIFSLFRNIMFGQ